MTRILICDDERDAVTTLSEKIAARYGVRGIETVGVCSGEELLSVIATKKPLQKSTDTNRKSAENLQADAENDIILLDIQMPNMSGMETAKELRRQGNDAVIIFLTGLEEPVFDAFEVEAFRYLVKPVSDDLLYAALDAAIEKVERNSGQNGTENKAKTDLFIIENGQHVRVPISDIIYAEVFNRQIILHCTGGTHEYYGKMAELEELTGNTFYRSHRSYLLNLRYVTGYSGREITTKGGTVILSKKKYPEFVRIYMAYLKGEL